MEVALEVQKGKYYSMYCALEEGARVGTPKTGGPACMHACMNE